MTTIDLGGLYFESTVRTYHGVGMRLEGAILESNLDNLCQNLDIHTAKKTGRCSLAMSTAPSAKRCRSQLPEETKTKEKQKGYMRSHHETSVQSDANTEVDKRHRHAARSPIKPFRHPGPAMPSTSCAL